MKILILSNHYLTVRVFRRELIQKLSESHEVVMSIPEDEAEYMEKVYPTRRELEYTYVQKAGIFYDLKMIIYTVICIAYSLCGKECIWILNELKADAAASANENPNENDKK